MIDQKTIAKIASLARLEISEKDMAKFSEQLSGALAHFEQISKINTEGVEPLVTPAEMTQHWREDKVKREMTASEIMNNAPEKRGNLFVVPPVV
jgi:aspartyl-tRNA(Asn)/glutamyl-tRNA(Gln) amidotransferase subunit C